MTLSTAGQAGKVGEIENRVSLPGASVIEEGEADPVEDHCHSERARL